MLENYVVNKYISGGLDIVMQLCGQLCMYVLFYV